jgi:hypothetical protein
MKWRGRIIDWNTSLKISTRSTAGRAILRCARTLIRGRFWIVFVVSSTTRAIFGRCSLLQDALLMSDDQEAVKMVKNARHVPGARRQKNGRHEETRTPDLYRVKVAL